MSAKGARGEVTQGGTGCSERSGRILPGDKNLAEAPRLLRDAHVAVRNHNGRRLSLNYTPLDETSAVDLTTASVTMALATSFSFPLWLA